MIPSRLARTRARGDGPATAATADAVVWKPIGHRSRRNRSERFPNPPRRAARPLTAMSARGYVGAVAGGGAPHFAVASRADIRPRVRLTAPSGAAGLRASTTRRHRGAGYWQVRGVDNGGVHRGGALRPGRPMPPVVAEVFVSREGHALGLIPPLHSQGEFEHEPSEVDVFFPVAYHGGSVMAGGVTVHTIFWAPSGYAFQGSPGAGIPTYKGLIQQTLHRHRGESLGRVANAKKQRKSATSSRRSPSTPKESRRARSPPGSTRS